ncbi:helix-turn-helix domain-containing protein [Catenulispora yoronensis]
MATYEPETDGGRIRRLRKRAGLTQAEFGQLMGRSQGWVSGIENGDIELDSVTLIVRAASVLKVYPNEITGRPYDPGTPAEDRGHRAIPAIRRVVSRHDLPPDWPADPAPGGSCARPWPSSRCCGWRPATRTSERPPRA